MDRVEAIRERIRRDLDPEELVVRDDSALHAGHAGAAGGAGHYTVTVVSAQFEGKPPLARHRMVYAAVADMMRDQIHALSIDARAPGERR